MLTRANELPRLAVIAIFVLQVPNGFHANKEQMIGIRLAFHCTPIVYPLNQICHIDIRSIFLNEGDVRFRARDLTKFLVLPSPCSIGSSAPRSESGDPLRLTEGIQS